MSTSVGNSVDNERTGENVPDNASVVSDSGVSEKAASVKSTSSGIPKPSGIKPPSISSISSSSTSRIGRLCLGQQKPALPPVTPIKHGSDDTLRRLTDEFGRHKLTDVQEENEEDASADTLTAVRRNRYSSIGSTASSTDYLWELYPRRLSEAGLSRHSDNSTILTEDTDSFIIGQRVWVGGTKPGSIAYIGETQFAPGDWAGIVLDQPIGKNDGSVGGIRYFQCEPKKGVFSRLTRLTRYSLNDPEMTVTDHVTSTPINGSRRSPVSPSGSTSPFKSPPSLTTSNTSLASAHIDFKLGDRVIIKSSQGSKIGTLRFLGATEFAAGEWCGVELDEPRGKNDGSVGGKRYFECRPNFGLFAPIAKVSKSPSNRKPTGCVVHSGAGIPPSGFRRANSKESLTSNTSITSAASGVRRVRLGVTSLTTPQRASPKTPAAPLPTRTALQEVLKEKQQHIEQLLKERDLERAEIAKAASQADEAEQKYATLKQEYEFHKNDCEKRFQEHKNILTQLATERSELLANLEDEKRKNEDIQFRFEEAAITKADLEQKNSDLLVANESNMLRIMELENQLTVERQRTEVFEGESNKLFEAEENLVRIKEENEVLKYEIEVAAKKIQLLESEGSSNKDLVTSHRKELDDLQSVVKQKDDIIDKIKTDIKSISDQYELSRINFTKEVEDYKSKINTSNNEHIELKTSLEVLKAELHQTKNELNEKTVALEMTINSAKDEGGKLNKEIEKLKMNLSSKNLDLETNTELLKKKEQEIKELNLQLESFRDNFETQNTDINKVKDIAKEVENNLRRELEENRLTIKAKINEVEESKKEFAVTLSQKESELKEANKTIKSYLEDIEKLNENIAEIKEVNLKSVEELQHKFSQKISELEEKNSSLMKALHEKEEILTRSSEEVSKLHIEIINRDEELKKIHKDLDFAKKRIDENADSASKTGEEINQLRLNVNDLERKLKVSEEKLVESQNHKIKLEDEVQTLIGSSGDFSVKLDEMTKELREKDKNSENVKNELITKLQDTERSKEEIELKFNSYIQKSEKEIKDRDETITNLKASKDLMKDDYDKILADSRFTIDAQNTKVNELQISLENKDNLLKKVEEETKQNQEKSKLDLEMALQDHNIKVNNLQKKFDDLSKDSEETKESLAKRSIELIEMESKYNQQVEISKQTEYELKSTYDEKIRNLELQLAEKEKEKLDLIEKAQNQLIERVEKMDNQSHEVIEGLNENILSLQKEKEEYVEKLNSLSVENERLKENSDKVTIHTTKTINDLTVKIKELEGFLQEKDLNLQKLKEEFALKEEGLNQQLCKYSGDLESNLTNFQSQINNLSEEKLKIQNALLEKQEQIGVSEVKYNELVEETKQKINTLQSSFEEEKKKLLEQLSNLCEENRNKNVEIEKLKDVSNANDLLSNDKMKEIAQLKSELQINHNLIERLKSEKKDLLEQKDKLVNAEQENDKQCTQLNNTISQLSKEIQNANENSYNLQMANNFYVTILQLLQLTEKQKINLVDKMEAGTKDSCSSDEYNKLCKLVDNIKIYEINEDDSKDNKIKELQKEIETYKHKQYELETALKRQQSQIPKPKHDSQKDAKKVVNNETKVDNSKTSSMVNNNPITNEQLMEEKLLAESQVAFLNSIIIDMQKKNEEQKARIEILESGYSPAAADELHLLRLTDRNLPPRMYCDICEEFDLHETEDCPQQANEDLPAREKSPKDKPPPRPYCEICEMFGHATEDCQEDQTF